MQALSLTAPALAAAVAAYHQRCDELGLGQRLADPVYAEVLHFAVLLSQRLIEGRKLRLTLLMPAENLDLARLAHRDRSCGVVHVQLPDPRARELTLSGLDPYLGSAPDEASLFVIQQLHSSKAHRLSLLYFGKPLTPAGRGRCEQGSVLALVQSSLTIRVAYGIVSVGVGLDWFLTLQQGEMQEIPRFECEIDAILAVSGCFRTQRDAFLGQLQQRLTLGDRGMAAQEVHRSISAALREIIATIAHAQHGTTLVFGTQSSLHDTMHYQPGALSLDLPLGEALLEQLACWRDALLGPPVGPDEQREQEQHEKMAAERRAAIVRAIINLSQTDGAVVFDDRLTAIGSSTFLKVKESAPVQGGARRKSAQSFVRAHPGVVAVVISQDGFVSLCS